MDVWDPSLLFVLADLSGLAHAFVAHTNFLRALSQPRRPPIRGHLPNEAITAKLSSIAVDSDRSE